MTKGEGGATRCLLLLCGVMMKLELSPRLAAVADLVPKGAVLADIGTDHAYLPVHLLLEGRIFHTIAADIRPGPLDHARRTAAEYRVTECVDFRLCDGLSAIAPGDCDTVTIAGMGGETIAHILSQALWTRDGVRLVLQPQSTQNVLREFLVQSGYRIVCECVVREGERWYPILLVEGGAMAQLTPGEAVAGRPDTWVEQPERKGYLEWLLRRTRQQLDGLSKSVRPEDESRRKELLEVETFLEKWL